MSSFFCKVYFQRGDEMHKLLNTRKLKNNEVTLTVDTEHLVDRLKSLRKEECDILSDQLHNGLGQDLTCLKMSVYRLFKNSDVAETPELQEKIKEMITMIDFIMGSVREIAKDLRPRVLEEFGLISAIESLLFDYRSNTSRDYQLINHTKTINIHPATTNDILKICKALLSKTSGATINVTGDDQKTVILVQNHSKESTNTECTEEHLAFFKGLQDRALLFGGQISITCDEKTGFSALISIPAKS